MEGALKAQIEELNRCRSDYSTLFKNFKQARVIFDEKDQEKSNQIHLANKKIDKLQRKVDEYKQVIAVQKSARGGFANDVNQLKYATDLLETREKCIWDKHEIISTQNADLNKDVKLQCEIIQRQLAEIGKLNEIITDETVPKINFERLVSEIDAMRVVVQKEMISLDTHQQVKEKYAELQRRVEWEMIALEEYNTIADEAQSLKIKLQGCVPADDFVRLQESYQSSIKEIETVSASVLRITGGRDDALRLLLDEQSKQIVLEGHIQKIERELNASKIKEKETIAEIDRIRCDFDAADDNRKLTLQNYILLEAANSALSAQLESTRLQLDRELAARSKLEDSITLQKEALEYEKSDLQEELQCLQRSYVQETERYSLKSASESIKQKETLDAVNALHSVELEALHEKFNSQLQAIYADREVTRQVSEARHNEQILALQEGERSRLQAVSLDHQASTAAREKEHKQLLESIDINHTDVMRTSAVEQQHRLKSAVRDLQDNHRDELKALQATLEQHITNVQEQCDHLLLQKRKEEINVDLERIRADGATAELLTAKRTILEISLKLEEEKNRREDEERKRDVLKEKEVQNAKLLIVEQEINRAKMEEIGILLAKQRETEREKEIERERKHEGEVNKLREIEWAKDRDERERKATSHREAERQKETRIAIENERDRERCRELEREIEKEKYSKLEKEREIEKQVEKERAKDREKEKELEIERRNERESEREREREREGERKRERSREQERDAERLRETVEERERERKREKERDRQTMEMESERCREEDRENDRVVQKEREKEATNKEREKQVNDGKLSKIEQETAILEQKVARERSSHATEMNSVEMKFERSPPGIATDRSNPQSRSSDKASAFDDDNAHRMEVGHLKNDAQLVEIARSLEGCSFNQLIDIAARGMMKEDAGSTPDRLQQSISSYGSGRKYPPVHMQSPTSIQPSGHLEDGGYTADTLINRAHAADSRSHSVLLHFTDHANSPASISPASKSHSVGSSSSCHAALQEVRNSVVQSSSSAEQWRNSDTSISHRSPGSPQIPRRASPISRRGQSLGGLNWPGGNRENSPSSSLSSPPVTPAPPYRRTTGVNSTSKPSSSILEFDNVQRGQTVDKTKSCPVLSGVVPPSPSREELLDRLINLSKEARGSSPGIKSFLFASSL